MADTTDFVQDLRWWNAANYLTVAQIYLRSNAAAGQEGSLTAARANEVREKPCAHGLRPTSLSAPSLAFRQNPPRGSVASILVPSRACPHTIVLAIRGAVADCVITPRVDRGRTRRRVHRTLYPMTFSPKSRESLNPGPPSSKPRLFGALPAGAR